MSLEQTSTTPCDRGCTIARRHGQDCEDADTCQGCQPRPARHGLLCESCHESLLAWLKAAPGQHALLQLSVFPTLEQQLHDSPGTGEIDAPAPMNLEAITVALYLTDVLSGWVEMLAQDYQMTGPNPLLTDAEREGTRRPLVSTGTYGPRPPELFEIGSACRWLLAQIDRLEYSPGIGDLWGELGQVMARAHAVAPWRELVARLKGVECPECHRFALAHHGGNEHVTCDKCQAKISPGRYAIWVRHLVDERGKRTEQQA